MKRNIYLISIIITLAIGSVYPLTASWQKLNMPTDEGFNDIWALSEETIFALGDQGLWKTFNGTDWVMDTVGGGIYFVDDTLGFLSGYIITTDGGKTWQKGDTVNGFLYDISFPQGQSVIGYGLGYDHASKTIDGGWHWSELSPFPDVYSGLEELIDPRYLCFPSDTDTGFVTVNCIKIVDGSPTEDHTSYFKTTDGGQSWVLNEEGLWNDDFNPRLVDFPENASVGYMSGGYLQGTTWIGCLYKTINGGATWDTVLRDRPPIISMCFPEGDQVGYVFGDSVANKTTDGGKTWKQTIITNDSTFYASHFPNNQVGFITGYCASIKYSSMPFQPGFVLKTTDGLIGIAEENRIVVEPQLVELSAPAFFSNELKVSYSSKSPGYIQASVFDASGRQVRSLEGRNVLSQGTILIPGAKLSSGVYFVRVEFRSTGGSENKTLRTVKIR